jgi:hypothetical protein
MPRILIFIAILFVVGGFWAAIDTLGALREGRILLNIAVVQGFIGWLLLTRKPAGHRWAIRWCWLVLVFLVLASLVILFNDRFFGVWGQEISLRDKLHISFMACGTFILVLWTLQYLSRSEIYGFYGRSAPLSENRAAHIQRVLGMILLTVFLLYNGAHYLYGFINPEVKLHVVSSAGTTFDGFCSYKVTSFSIILLGNDVGRQRDVAINIDGTIAQSNVPEERRFNGTRGECIVRTTSRAPLSLFIIQADGSIIPQEAGRMADSQRVTFGGRR